MIKSIDEYLFKLKKELSGCDPVVVEEALSNSEEHLREALKNAHETDPGRAEPELLREIVEKYGMPDEIALTYKESEAIENAFLSKKGNSVDLVGFLITLFTAAYFLGQGIVLLWWNDMSADGFIGLQEGYIFYTWALLCLMMCVVLWWFAGYVWTSYRRRKNGLPVIVYLVPVFPFLSQGIALLCYWLTQPEGCIRRESGSALIISIISLALAFILLVIWVWVVIRRHASSAKVSPASPENLEKELTLPMYLFLVFPLVAESIPLLFYWAADEAKWERIGKEAAHMIGILLLEFAFVPLLTWIVAMRYQSLRKGQQADHKKLKYFVIPVSLLLIAGIFTGTFILPDLFCSHRGSTLEGPVREQWVARYNGSADSYDYVNAMVVDDSGNIYVTGCGTSASTGSDYITIKYNSDGNQQWVALYDGSAHGEDIATDIVVDDEGNAYVTGSSKVLDDHGEFDHDSVTVKYDSNGNQVWIASYSGPVEGYDGTWAIALDTSGNVYVTGYGAGDGTETDYITIKYDSDGNQLWVTRYDGPASLYDWGGAIAIDDSGNIYVTGESYGDGTKSDYATIKYDSDGHQLWVVRYNGPAFDSDVAQAIAIDDSGDIYVTGFSDGDGTKTDFATIKYDSDGNQLWVARYNGPDSWYDMAGDVVLDRSGNVYVTGYGISHVGDFATIKYDSDGNQLWVAHYDGPASGDDRAHAIALDPSGNYIYVTGESPYSGEDYEDWDTDAVTICYDTAGNQVWSARYNGPGSGQDMTKVIAVDSEGNIYVAGQSVGDGTNDDYLIIKYTPE